MRAELLIVLGCAAGCALDFDAVGPQAGDGGGDLGGASSTSSSNGGGSDGGGNDGGGGDGDGGMLVVSCEDRAGKCLPVPTGFDGAVQLLEGRSCSAQSAVFEGGTEYTAAPAVCQCACEAETTACSLPQARAYSTPSCGVASPNLAFAVSAACSDVPVIMDLPARSVRFDDPPTPPACGSNGAAAMIPPVTFAAPVAGCDFDSIGCDDGEVCLPSTGDTFCFFGESGAGPCPADFVRRTVLRPSDFSDNRDCVCECSGNVGGACTPPTWELFTSEDCLPASELMVTQNLGCHEGAGLPIGSARASSMSTGTSCDPGTKLATGGANPIGFLTLCCR